MGPDGFDLDAYLSRIGASRPLTASLEALRALHQAHAAAIPFENLDVLLGRPIRLDLNALQAKLVARRRGGYCFEQNTLFSAALETIGFRVSPLAARVRAGASAVRPRTHMLLRVELPEGPWLADVGFGGDGLVHPLAFDEEKELWIGVFGHRLRRDGELWVLQSNLGGAWGDLYAFTLEPQHPADYEMANHFTSTWPGSPFVNNLTAQRCWPERRALLRNRDLIVREAGGEMRQTIRDPEHLLEILDGVFGLSFPAGTRFPKPEW